MERIIGLIKRFSSLFKYGLISLFVTVIDVVISRLSEGIFSVVVANGCGVVTGFIIQYFLTGRFVYNKRNFKTFAIFFGTFLLNLLMASVIIYIFRILVFDGSGTSFAFLVSKGCSIVIPFFITYAIRKKLIMGRISDE